MTKSTGDFLVGLIVIVLVIILPIAGIAILEAPAQAQDKTEESYEYRVINGATQLEGVLNDGWDFVADSKAGVIVRKVK